MDDRWLPAWQREGLKPPASVRAATDDYLNAEDVLGQWLDERCIVSPRSAGPRCQLYGAWKIWCEARGQNPGTSTALSKKLDERGFRRQNENLAPGLWASGLPHRPPAAPDDTYDGSPHNNRSDRPHARAHITPIMRGTVITVSRPTRRRPMGVRPVTAAALVREARAAGVELRLVDGTVKVRGKPAPELLARLREHKASYRRHPTRRRLPLLWRAAGWPGPAGVVFADGTAECMRCCDDEVERLLAAGRRAVNPELAADPAEVTLRGEVDP